MRLDRLITLYFARFLAGKGGAEDQVPILMYHSISGDPENGVAPYYKTVTSPAVFEAQIRLMTEQGFRSVDLVEADKILSGKSRAPKRPVVITFDDGFRDFHKEAFPILKKYGQTAVMFLPTAFIGRERNSFKEKECLTWAEIREMRAYGIEFGSHTVNHPKLYQLPWKDIENELAASKEQIERELGEKAPSFAYPYAFPQQDGDFTGKLKEILQRLGYENCVTTIVGRARAGEDLFSLKRLPVNSCDDDRLLMAKLDGAYDWFATPQRIFKSINPRKMVRQPNPA